jgi:hypothetical protein
MDGKRLSFHLAARGVANGITRQIATVIAIALPASIVEPPPTVTKASAPPPRKLSRPRLTISIGV